MAEDRWTMSIAGVGERVKGQETLQLLLADFAAKLANKGFTVVSAKLSYTGVTIVVESPQL